jgi:hypothetical protein
MVVGVLAKDGAADVRFMEASSADMDVVLR